MCFCIIDRTNNCSEHTHLSCALNMPYHVFAFSGEPSPEGAAGHPFSQVIKTM